MLDTTDKVNATIRPMLYRVKSSAVLLLFLGVLFSVPIAAKTMSAHGIVPGLVTGMLVVLFVFLGPISFVTTGAIEKGVVGASAIATDFEVLFILMLGAGLVLTWWRLLARGPGYSIPYLPVSVWAFSGAMFCVLQVFAHVT